MQVRRVQRTEDAVPYKIVDLSCLFFESSHHKHSLVFLTIGTLDTVYLFPTWRVDQSASLIAPITIYPRREEFHDDGNKFII